MSIANNPQAVITDSARQTQALAREIARSILSVQQAGPVVLALRGNLGSGKTTFVQGLAKGLGVKNEINSPTFVIMKKFKIQNSKFKTFKNFYHIDCYRLNKPEEILSLGWQEIIANPKNIVAVEWPGKIKKFLPKQTTCLIFKFVNKNQRSIKFQFQMLNVSTCVDRRKLKR
ncbi:MAG: tRNA (adenosine(37)-N6)-threonylcarbamoyltransferase complex ATPase subunit type 1 TsaE [Patescibacteria group bacterium]|nr:tRNA (adenosine(37)-N6)-threonylcarbamoyltransferase complex ATPase subunit type 1 TsaE [Patescibacteria group bacterium]